MILAIRFVFGIIRNGEHSIFEHMGYLISFAAYCIYKTLVISSVYQLSSDIYQNWLFLQFDIYQTVSSYLFR